MRSQFRLVVASTLALLIGMGAMPAASGDEPGTGATATPLPGSSTTGVPSQGSSSGTDQADTGGADGRSAGSGVATGDGAASVAVAEDAGPAEYMYDAAGRLVAVVSDETGEVAEYSYDATGNITGVERRPDSELSVLSVVPLTASTGDEVVVRGTGFTSGLAVTVGGEAVTVQDVTATSASFLVPDGASGGRVAVTVGGDSASGPGLTVMEGPSITQISPLSGLPGTEVEITGSGFAAEAQDNVVSIGGQLAEVVSVTPTTVRAVVPVSAGFGKVKVRTPAGDAASDDEFLVSIEGVDISAIESVQRVEVGGDPIDVRVTEAGNAALVVFDMPEGRHVDLGITGATFSGYTDYGYVGPDGQERMHFLSNGEALRQVTGAAGRTYGLIVEPEDAGQVTVTLSEPVGGDLATTGASTVVALERPGQTARTTIDLSAGDDLTLTASEASIGYRYIEVFGPDGESVDSAFGSGTSQVFNVDAIQEAGTYTVQVRPTTPSTGSVVLTASLSRDAGELSLTGASTEFVVGRAGQEVFGTLELSV
ncbi:IPT/TIG domain-containing protein, partial [Myceligenerans salitolerans]